MAGKGIEFENLVRDFYSRIDPHAVVKFDHHVVDVDTGTRRQVDGWIEMRVADNLLIRILISCKNHNRPLDIRAIESAEAERRSTGAHVCVLYSSSGFSEPALKKASSLSVSCKHFFTDRPPEAPDDVPLFAFVAHPIQDLLLPPVNLPAALKDMQWTDIFGPKGIGREAAVRWSTELAQHCVRSVMAQTTAGRTGPIEAAHRCTFPVPAGKHTAAFKIWHTITWEWSRARLNALRLRGSLDRNDGSFVGAVTVGPIEMHSKPADSRWETSGPPPAKSQLVSLSAFALAAPDADDILSILNRSPLRSERWTFRSAAASLAPPGGQAIEFTVNFPASNGPGGRSL